MRLLPLGFVALSLLLAPTALAEEVVIDPEVGAEFHTYVTKEKVRVYDPADIAVGVELADTYELAPVPDLIVERSPKLKGYRYVTIGKRIAIVEPSSRKVIRFVD